MIDPKRTVVVANPAAGAGRVGRTREAFVKKLRAGLGACEVLFTKARGEASDLAAQAQASGATTVVSLGGDGTHNEVINGLLRKGPSTTVQLGVLSAGTGGDFCRATLGGHDLEAGMRAITEAPATRIDVGKTRFVSDGGERQERYFLNIASCGVTGLICRLVEQTGKQFGGRAAFLLGTMRGLSRYKPARVRVLLDGQPLLGDGEIPITTLAVCNSQFAGGGMRFAPEARVTDGQLDVVCIQPSSLWNQIVNTPKLYKGQLGGLPNVSQHRGRRLQVELAGEHPAYVEFDGEAPGFAPVEFEVVPGALPMLGMQSFVL